jgi:glycosyltransferase involved in cell wall biosynthesis
MAESCDRIVRSLRAAGAWIDVLHLSRRALAAADVHQEGGRLLRRSVGADASHDLNVAWAGLSRDPELTAATHVVAFGGALPLFAAPVLAAWLELPLITLIRGNDFDAAVFSPRRREALREAIERAARVCAVSTEKVARIERLYPGTGVDWTPNGIDLTRFEPLDDDREAARRWRSASVEADRRVIGLFGQLKRKKGADLFLDALERSGVAERVHLLAAGDLEPEAAARLARVPGGFTTLPFLDRYQLLPYYLACDLVGLPSLYDGMPNVLLEAAALGIPVLGSTAGGVPDVIENGRSGILFPPGDVEACVEAVRGAVGLSNEELARLGESARATVRERFDHRAEAERYVEVLRAALEEPSPVG